MSEPASTEFITAGVAMGEICHTAGDQRSGSNARAAHHHRFRVKTVLLVDFCFFGEENNNVTHADGRHADLDLS